MTEAGVPLRQQQVWQIESGSPPRRLSVGEAAAIARVFGISLSDLMTPPEEVASQNLVNLGKDFAAWRRDAGLLAARLREIDERAGQLLSGSEENFTASNAVKWTGLSGLAEQAAAEFDEMATAYADIAQSVRSNGTIWSLISSLRELVMDEDTTPEGEPSGDDRQD